LLPVDEEDHVRVLLDRSGLAEVGELRALVLSAARLDTAVELRERHHRDLELLRQRLERAADLADLLLPALDLAPRAHELEVVDDDEPEAVLGLEPPRLAAQLHDR